MLFVMSIFLLGITYFLFVWEFLGSRCESKQNHVLLCSYSLVLCYFLAYGGILGYATKLTRLWTCCRLCLHEFIVKKKLYWLKLTRLCEMWEISFIFTFFYFDRCSLTYKWVHFVTFSFLWSQANNVQESGKRKRSGRPQLRAMSA